MNNKITQEDINLVMNALAGQPIVSSSAFANKIEKILKNYDELKENYINEKMLIYKLTVPDGHCCYPYFDFNNNVECGDYDCSECKRKFFQDLEQEVRRQCDKIF